MQTKKKGEGSAYNEWEKGAKDEWKKQKQDEARVHEKEMYEKGRRDWKWEQKRGNQNGK
jgi:hypothetical protein